MANKHTTKSPSLGIKPVQLREAISERYLSYALSTITARSLPDVRDGLKPVHRRILYAMYTTGNTPEKQHRKCANAVGYVMMHFHPHGDGAIYDSLVRMAQPFLMRLPLIEGQGNFGSIDGDNPAAMRYTECRLSSAGVALMQDIEQNTVDFAPNYNGQMQEPKVLPASYPNLLVNGAMGIAVGMATNIPPHNLAETYKALRFLIKNPQASTKQIMKYIAGPDFPTGGMIIEPHDSLVDTYESGRGSIRLRARWDIEELKNGLYQIIISEIPYQVQKARLIEKIADLLLNKKLPLLQDLRDESAEDIRIVLAPKNRTVDPKVLMESLFRATDLEIRFGVNMNVLNPQGAPEVMGLKAVLQAFLDHRHQVLVRRSQYRHQKIQDRLEVLQGLLIVYLNIDEVIQIIRFEEEPAQVLKDRFQLSDIQVEAILNMRLRALRKLEQMKIEKEVSELQQESKDLEKLLNDEQLRWQTIDAELASIGKTFAEARRTNFASMPDDLEVPIEAIVEKEPITIIISEQGWGKVIKGHGINESEVKYRDGDGPGFILPAFTTDKLLIMTSEGRGYTLGMDKLPGGRGYGEPLRVILELSPETKIADIFVHSPGSMNKRLLVSSDARGFVVHENDLVAQTKQGKQVLNITAPHYTFKTIAIEGDIVAVIGENRKLLLFPITEIPEMSKGRGVLLQKYQSGQISDIIVTSLEKGLPCLQNTPSKNVNLRLWVGKRGQAGRTPPAGFPRNNKFSLNS